MNESTRFEFVRDATKLRVRARAPGHNFVAEATGLSGFFEISQTHVERLSVSLPLLRLKAPDPIGQSQLERFLDIRTNPIARAELISPIPVTTQTDGKIDVHGRLRVLVDHRRAEVMVAARISGEIATAEFSLLFTSLGYTPPKLLFLKVQDELRIEVEARVTKAT